jgi:hypothetical protein
VRTAATTSSTRTITYRVSSDAPPSETPLRARYAIVRNAVTEIAAPSRKAAELRCQFSLVARKIALRICGPAIITNASGRICRKSTRATSLSGLGT